MLPVPAEGWSLTGIECLSDTGGAGGSTFTYGGDGVFTVGDLEAGIQLAAGDSVTCTFTNTKDGSIKVVKSASPADSTEFGFTPSWTETEDTTLANGEMFSESLGPGLYTVSEMLPVPAEGWSLTGIECLSDTGGAGGSTFTYGGDGVFTVGDLEAGIDLMPTVRASSDMYVHEHEGWFDQGREVGVSRRFNGVWFHAELDRDRGHDSREWGDVQ